MSLFDWLPDSLGPLSALVILAVSFLGSATTAAFSIGGGLLLIAAMSALLPAPVVVPVHGVIMIGSNSGRALLLHRHVDWAVVGWFGAGTVLGGLVGGQIVVNMPATALRLAIAGFVLFTQWGPKVKLPLSRGSFVVTGVLSTILTLFVGATGPFLTAILSKIQHYSRINLVATAGAGMTLQHTIKVAVFALAGFAYAPWLPFIAACVIAGFAGTILGAQLLKRINERAFRTALKAVLTVLACYLIILGISEMLA